MGIFSRLSDVVNSNIHAMLDKAEDPEKMVRLIIQEMEDTMVEVRSTAVRALARKKEIQHALDQRRHDAEDWAAKAELAVTRNRDDLARGALGARERAVAQAAHLEQEATALELEIDKLDRDIAQLKTKLNDARQRQKAITLRRQSVSSRLKVKTTINDQRATEAMEKLSHYEGRIDRMEAELEAYDLGTRDLAHEFENLEADDRVERQLTELRARLREQTPAQPGN
jgi:phage shock protein A